MAASGEEKSYVMRQALWSHSQEALLSVVQYTIPTTTPCVPKLFVSLEPPSFGEMFNDNKRIHKQYNSARPTISIVVIFFASVYESFFGLLLC